jgi:hypothetical protein
MADLRGSYQVAAHSDLVSFIYRPAMYATRADIEKGEIRDTDAEMIWAKNTLSGDVEVEVERQEHEKYGVSYLLKPVSSPGARLGPKVDDLHGTVEQLGRTVADACNELARLVARVADLERHAGIQPAAAPPAPPAAPGERATF